MTAKLDKSVRRSEIEHPNDSENESDSVYDSDEYEESDYDSNEEENGTESSDDDSSEDGEEFEDQGSSDEDDDILIKKMKKTHVNMQDSDGEDESDVEVETLKLVESVPRHWASSASEVPEKGKKVKDEKEVAQWIHTDDLSSDDEDGEGTQNRIGRVPLHWYDEYEHIGYDGHGKKIKKPSNQGDLLDKVIEQNDPNNKSKKLTVYDALNAKEVEVTDRQLELIRRIQAGAYAHPEFDGNPDYIDYFSGVDKEISGINSNKYEPKSRFQPSKWEKMQVRKLLHRLQCGSISVDFLNGKIKDMNDISKKATNEDKDVPFLLWKGDEEDELHLRKGPQHIAAPKLPPPGHAESYNPAEEYLPTEEDIENWKDMDVQDRPHGLLIPKKFSSLRAVGAYEHSVRERFERCLDLYLCPRVMKRRLNIDPESLVPSLPKAADLRPFPTAKCIKFETPYTKENSTAPVIRCLSVSPDGQYLASGANDGFLRLWEIQTGRLLRSWNLSKLVTSLDPDNKDEVAETSTDELIKPLTCIQWNPNSSHHCLLVAVGKCAVIVASGTGGVHDAELTEALLTASANIKTSHALNAKAAKAVRWISCEQKKVKSQEKQPSISAFAGEYFGPVCILQTNREMANLKWHRKGDYFVTVSPKAGTAAVLIHQLSKASSQQPFSKNKGEAQTACFHPSKPFLFVATTTDVKVYHLVKQSMVKRLVSGCRWISDMDVHLTGDHVIIGSLDRRVVWFDLDLSSTPYKTLKYHERAVRSVGFHKRYPLMASSSDDGTVHVFHSTVYSDLMRNPLVVPVKILRGHTVTKRLGVLAFEFHPTQPWLFSAGADGQIHLFQDI